MGNYADLVLQDLPALYWKLDDASGNPQDSSGNARHAESNATLAYREAGVGAPLGGGDELYAILDDAAGDGCHRTTLTGLTGSVFTYEGWIYKTTDADGIFWAVGNCVTGLTGFYLQYEAATNKLRANVAATGSMVAISDAGIDLNTWYHVAITRTAGPLWKMYVNGVEQASAEVDAMTTIDTAIGLFKAPNSTVLNGEGKQAHFAIYQSVLSASRIAIHFAAAAAFRGGMAGAMLPAAIC